MCVGGARERKGAVYERLQAGAAVESLEPMLAQTDGGDELKRRNNSLDQHQAFAGSLARSVQNIHRYWVEQRRL